MRTAQLSKAEDSEYTDPGGGFAQVWADLKITLDGAARAVSAHYAKYERLWAHTHMVQLTCPPFAAASTSYDYPDILGPHTGYYWDIKRITLAPSPLWTGTIWVYNSNLSPVSLADEFTPSPNPVSHFYGKGHLLLSPHDRLLFSTSADFTGQAVLSGEAILVVDDCVPVYLT